MRISRTKLACAMLSAGIDHHKALAATAGISVNTISRLVNGGSITIPTLRRLADALRIDPTSIIEQDSSEKQKRVADTLDK